MKVADAIFYTVAQCLGALAGVGVFALIGGTFGKSIQLGLTVPGVGHSPMVAFDLWNQPESGTKLRACILDAVVSNSNGFTGLRPSLERWPRFQSSAFFLRKESREGAPSSFTLSITAAFFQTAATRVLECGELEVRERGFKGTEQVVARLLPGDWVPVIHNVPRSSR